MTYVNDCDGSVDTHARLSTDCYQNAPGSYPVIGTFCYCWFYSKKVNFLHHQIHADKFLFYVFLYILDMYHRIKHTGLYRSEKPLSILCNEISNHETIAFGLQLFWLLHSVYQREIFLIWNLRIVNLQFEALSKVAFISIPTVK